MISFHFILIYIQQSSALDPRRNLTDPYMKRSFYTKILMLMTFPNKNTFTVKFPIGKYHDDFIQEKYKCW